MPAVLVCAVSGSSVAVQDEPCLSFTARSSSVSRPRIGRQLVRKEAVEVRLSCRAGPSTDRSPGPRPRVDVGEARPSFSPGRPGSRRLSQPLLVWAGPLREPVEPCGHPRRVVSTRGACSPSDPHSESRMGLGGRVCAPRIFRRPSAPATARCRIRGTRWGLSIYLLVLSSGVALLLRGGGVAWAGVLAASATASEEPCMSALCVQVLI